MPPLSAHKRNPFPPKNHHRRVRKSGFNAIMLFYKMYVFLKVTMWFCWSSTYIAEANSCFNGLSCTNLIHLAPHTSWIRSRPVTSGDWEPSLPSGDLVCTSWKRQPGHAYGNTYKSLQGQLCRVVFHTSLLHRFVDLFQDLHPMGAQLVVEN